MSQHSDNYSSFSLFEDAYLRILLLSLFHVRARKKILNVERGTMSTGNSAALTSSSLPRATRADLGRGPTRNRGDTMMERWVAQVQKEKAAEGDDQLLRDVRAILSNGSIDQLRNLQTHITSTAWMFRD